MSINEICRALIWPWYKPSPSTICSEIWGKGVGGINCTLPFPFINSFQWPYDCHVNIEVEAKRCWQPQFLCILLDNQLSRNRKSFRPAYQLPIWIWEKLAVTMESIFCWRVCRRVQWQIWRDTIRLWFEPSQLMQPGMCRGWWLLAQCSGFLLWSGQMPTTLALIWDEVVHSSGQSWTRMCHGMKS